MEKPGGQLSGVSKEVHGRAIFDEKAYSYFMSIYMSPMKKVGIGLLMAGIGLIVFGIVLLIETMSFQSTAIIAQGKIIRLIEEVDGDGDTLYRPIFIFTDKNDHKHEIISNTATLPAVGQPGDLIDVFYQSGNPAGARIKNQFWEFFLPGLFLAIGFFGVYGGIRFIRER